MTYYTGENEKEDYPLLEDLLRDKTIDCQFCEDKKASKICIDCYRDQTDSFMCESCYVEHVAIKQQPIGS